MKIGILTHHAVINFGAYWQARSLLETVQKLYPDSEVCIINFIQPKHLFINNVGWFLFYKNKNNVRHWNNIFRLPFTLYAERKKHMPLTKICFTAEQINKLNLDTIIVGSDEVWNYNDPKSVSPIKFGEGLTCKNLISYAPSAGNSQTGNLPDFANKGLRRFNAISVRDYTTEKLVFQVTGKHPQIVLDPTLLVNWEVNVTPPVKKKDYILFYYCEHLPEQIKKQIFEYARNHGLAVYGAGDSDKDYDECNVNLKPEEWVAMFKNAKFIFTGTFHGVIFSILNHRQFKVYLTNKGRIAKVGNLLSYFSIKGREMDDQYVFDLEKQKNEIDYTPIELIIDKQRNESLDYLRNAIQPKV